MNQEPTSQQIGSWTLRVRAPEGPGPHPVFVLVHGWTGDENSMWVFSGRLPENALLIAPRGLHPAPQGGFSWHPYHERGWPDLAEFEPAVVELLHLLTPENFPGGDFSGVRLVGFSQGAALCYALAILNPKRVVSMAGLSGFLPQGVEGVAASQPLQGKAVFVAHGSLDERVPVERARQGVETLEAAGARVVYCEDQVGHKLSAACFRGLEHFFQNN